MTERETELERDGLEPWFIAARAASPQPPPALVSAILADAAREVGERRRVAGAALSRPAWWRTDLGSWLRSAPGPGGAAALTACAVAGFLVGASALTDGAVDAIWPGADPVTDFFELAEAN